MIKMINDEKEKLIHKQLDAINMDFKVLTSHMIILKDYFDQLVDAYKNGEYFEEERELKPKG